MLTLTCADLFLSFSDTQKDINQKNRLLVKLKFA